MAYCRCRRRPPSTPNRSLWLPRCPGLRRCSTERSSPSTATAAVGGAAGATREPAPPRGGCPGDQGPARPADAPDTLHLGEPVVQLPAPPAATSSTASPSPAPAGPWHSCSAGIPGLEPELTEPETVGLPITPYPTTPAATEGVRSSRGVLTAGADTHHATGHLSGEITLVLLDTACSTRGCRL